MIPLPPHAQALAGEIADAAPPLSPAQQRIIQRVLAGPPAPPAAQAA